MLLLLLIAKGWTITSHSLDDFSKLFLFTVWSAYSAASVALFLWNQVKKHHGFLQLCLCVFVSATFLSRRSSYFQ